MINIDTNEIRPSKKKHKKAKDLVSFLPFKLELLLDKELKELKNELKSKLTKEKISKCTLKIRELFKYIISTLLVDLKENIDEKGDFNREHFIAQKSELDNDFYVQLLETQNFSFFVQQFDEYKASELNMLINEAEIPTEQLNRGRRDGKTARENKFSFFFGNKLFKKTDNIDRYVYRISETSKKDSFEFKEVFFAEEQQHGQLTVREVFANDFKEDIKSSKVFSVNQIYSKFAESSKKSSE